VTDIARCDVAGHFPQNRPVRNLYRTAGTEQGVPALSKSTT